MSIFGKIKRLKREFSGVFRQSPTRTGLPEDSRKDLVAPHGMLFRNRALSAEQQALPGCTHDLVSILVLSYNGAGLLNQLLSSASRFETCRNYEFLISTQSSSDHTEQIIDTFSKALPIKKLNPGKNLSFSKGVNFLAKKSRGPILLLLNNDFQFLQPVICETAQYLTRPEIGACGIALTNKLGQIDQYGVNFHFDLAYSGIRPVNIPNWVAKTDVELVPAITGAFLMTRSTDFRQLQGLDEAFHYGYEDIDYCLRMIQRLGKAPLLVGNLKGLHITQTSRRKMPGQIRQDGLRRNWLHFQKKHGHSLRAAMRGALSPSILPRPPSIVISATKASRDPQYGDTYVGAYLEWRLNSLGLKTQLQTADFAHSSQPEINSYWLHLVNHSIGSIGTLASKALTSIAWVRNWSYKWSAHHLFLRLNWVGFSGSSFASQLDQIGYNSRKDFLRLGTDPRVNPLEPIHENRDIDYLWSANFHNVKRLPQDLRRIPRLTGVAAGSGWSSSALPNYIRKGPMEAGQLANLYRRTKTVIDEAGVNTQPEGSLNLRFWEALAAGALPLTNNKKGLLEAFPFDVPSWSSLDELEAQINFWCANDSARVKLVERMRRQKPPHHGLEEAAETIRARVEVLNQLPRVCLLNPAPHKDEKYWGDTFLLSEFSNLLQDAGFVTHVLPLEHHNSLGRLEAEVVVVLHGREIVRLNPGQVNIIWIVSNPDLLSQEYLSEFDEVWVSSNRAKSELLNRWGVRAELVLPGAAPVFSRREPELGFEDRDIAPLIIGNTLGRVRPAVIALTKAGVKLEVIGQGWDGILPKNQILGDSISRLDAAKEYQSRRVVISDTREAMREWGIYPPRVWEAILAGAVPISDKVSETGKAPSLIPSWEKPQDLLLATEALTTEKSEWEKVRANLEWFSPGRISLASSAKFGAERIWLLLDNVRNPLQRTSNRPQSIGRQPK